MAILRPFQNERAVYKGIFPALFWAGKLRLGKGLTIADVRPLGEGDFLCRGWLHPQGDSTRKPAFAITVPAVVCCGIGNKIHKQHGARIRNIRAGREVFLCAQHKPARALSAYKPAFLQRLPIGYDNLIGETHARASIAI